MQFMHAFLPQVAYLWHNQSLTLEPKTILVHQPLSEFTVDKVGVTSIGCAYPFLETRFITSR